MRKRLVKFSTSPIDHFSERGGVFIQEWECFTKLLCLNILPPLRWKISVIAALFQTIKQTNEKQMKKNGSSNAANFKIHIFSTSGPTCSTTRTTPACSYKLYFHWPFFFCIFILQIHIHVLIPLISLFYFTCFGVGR